MKKKEEKDERESCSHPPCSLFPLPEWMQRPNGPDPRRAAVVFRCVCVCEFAHGSSSANRRREPEEKRRTEKSQSRCADVEPNGDEEEEEDDVFSENTLNMFQSLPVCTECH